MVERPFPADPEIYAGRADQSLGLRQHEVGFNRRRGRHQLFGQPLALGDVEHREPLEESNRPGFIAGLKGLAPFVLGRKTVGVNDGRAALALAHMAAKAQRLAKGQPALPGKSVLDHSAPQNEHIDSGIAPICRGVLGHA